MPEQKITVVILAGGESRRMGTSKAALLFKGEPLLVRIQRRLEPLSIDFIVVTRDGYMEIPFREHTRPAADALAGEGPLSGLVGGLGIARNPITLAVSCDLPFVSLEVVASLASLLDEEHDAVIPVVEGRRQPVHAVYCSEVVLKTGAKLLSEGKRSMNDLMAQLRVLEVDEKKLLHIENWRDSFTNVNTKEELCAAEKKSVL